MVVTDVTVDASTTHRRASHRPSTPSAAGLGRSARSPAQSEPERSGVEMHGSPSGRLATAVVPEAWRLGFFWG